MQVNKWPKISVVIPTLNAESVLEPCLQSIIAQDYPKDCIEIIIADGGSTDHTLALAKKSGCILVHNKLKTGEAGKLAGVKVASGEFIALIDSDNVLPSTSWFKDMVFPLLLHAEAVGSEPLYYTWRESDGFITRYCALLGMNDPFAHFIGNYDRMNLITNKWTEVPHSFVDYGGYLYIGLTAQGIPTIGANGTIFRSKFLNEYMSGDYLFDIDLVALAIESQGSVSFVKVNCGIIHTFCEANIRKFSRKQRRRIKDYLYYKKLNLRIYDWSKYMRKGNGSISFIVSCLTVFPLLIQALVGYLRKPDRAWLFHVLACELTLFEYVKGSFLSLFRLNAQDRTQWKQ